MCVCDIINILFLKIPFIFHISERERERIIYYTLSYSYIIPIRLRDLSIILYFFLLYITLFISSVNHILQYSV